MPQYPLSGITVVEFAGLAPGPFAGLILADWGATVIRIDKKGQSLSTDVLSRGKLSLAIDPKVPTGLETLKLLIRKADVLIDPFRPGTMERLGLGPLTFLGKPNSPGSGINPRLIYARVCGFPPMGPHKSMAGHDLNYLALSGLLSLMPPSETSTHKPSFPLNILADFAGGGLTSALGILLALLERERSGLGQVVENNMVDGARYVASFPIIHSSHGLSSPWFGNTVGKNLLDGGAPFYDLYLCKDNKWISVACLEPQFYRTFLNVLLETLSKNSEHFLREWSVVGTIPKPADQMDRGAWPATRKFLEAAFLQLERDIWSEAFHDTDACAIPVLSLSEGSAIASKDMHPAPAAHPLLSRTPAIGTEKSYSQVCGPSDSVNNQGYLLPGQHTIAILQDVLEMNDFEVELLARDGAISSDGTCKSIKAKL